jgi:hypothetical protein
MIQIILAKVVLRQIRDIRELHVRDVAGAEEPDIHLFASPLRTSTISFLGVRLYWVVRLASDVDVSVDVDVGVGVGV